MSNLKEINKLVKTLEQGINSENILTVNNKNNAVVQVVRILEDHKYLVVVEESISGLKVKVTKHLSNIQMDEPKSLKTKNIFKYAAKALPSLTGVIILSTPKGMLSHFDAANRKQGGRPLVKAF
jgi:ribosomal protein S8